MAPKMTQHIEYMKYYYPPYRRFIMSPVGSWNYGCADENSDVDTKVIILPNIEEVIHDECISRTYIFPNQEHCEIVDIRNFMKSLQKGNPQFIEVLFSNWIYLNSEYYGEETYSLMKLREDIARCNPQNTMRAMLGMADRNYGLCNTRTEEDHASKWLYQLLRIEEQMKKYMLGETFEKCLKTDNRENLLYIKNNKWQPKEIKAMSSNSIYQCTTHYEAFKAMYHDIEENKFIQRTIEEIVKQVCRKSISEVD